MDNRTANDKAPVTLRLYVAGSAPASSAAEANLRQACGEILGDGYALDIIDVEAQPHRALADRVFATPTLVRVWPEPQRRLVGDLSADDILKRLLDG